ncbi:hypothetical protein ABGB12_13605 [Actinocorallia sp. B10E7]|uniref:hypothetical protein n=1 Tax=Actinocorallia sp. B10E7 TaxID=3153558 RepID=UPI00325EE2C0
MRPPVLTQVADGVHFVRTEAVNWTILWRPGFPAWALHIVRAGALKDVRVPGAEAFPAPGPLDLLEPLPAELLLPGHGPHRDLSPGEAVALVRSRDG